MLSTTLTAASIAFYFKRAYLFPVILSPLLGRGRKSESFHTAID